MNNCRLKQNFRQFKIGQGKCSDKEKKIRQSI